MLTGPCQGYMSPIHLFNDIRPALPRIYVSGKKLTLEHRKWPSRLTLCCYNLCNEHSIFAFFSFRR